MIDIDDRRSASTIDDRHRSSTAHRILSIMALHTSRPKGCPHSRGTSAALLLPRTSGGALLIESPPQPLCTPAPASWASHTSVCMHQHLWPHPQTRPPHEHTPGGGSSWRAAREQRAACGGGGHWTMCSWLSPQLTHTGSLAPTAGQDGHVCNM